MKTQGKMISERGFEIWIPKHQAGIKEQLALPLSPLISNIAFTTAHALIIVYVTYALILEKYKILSATSTYLGMILGTGCINHLVFLMETETLWAFIMR
jgi:hypothetical protein